MFVIMRKKKFSAMKGKMIALQNSLDYLLKQKPAAVKKKYTNPTRINNSGRTISEAILQVLSEKGVKTIEQINKELEAQKMTRWKIKKESVGAELSRLCRKGLIIRNKDGVYSGEVVYLNKVKPVMKDVLIQIMKDGVVRTTEEIYKEYLKIDREVERRSIMARISDMRRDGEIIRHAYGTYSWNGEER